MTQIIKPISMNGHHIGSVERTALGWVAYSALQKLTAKGPFAKYTAPTRRRAIDWLETIAENKAMA